MTPTERWAFINPKTFLGPLQYGKFREEEKLAESLYQKAEVRLEIHLTR